MSGDGTALLRPSTASSLASVPKLYATARAAKRFIEYFAVNIRNPNTRRAYFRTVLEFSSWCAVTPSLVALGIGWALAMGVIGGLVPAVRAARVPVTVALRRV